MAKEKKIVVGWVSNVIPVETREYAEIKCTLSYGASASASTDTDTNTNAGIDTDTGADVGTDPDTGTDVGTDTDTGTGTDTDTVADAGIGTGTGTGNGQIINPKDIENADKYIFHVRRYKDKATREEHLNVKVYESRWNGSEVEATSTEICAEIEKATIVELESRLLNLRVYGVILGRKYFPKVRQIIEKTYPDLAIHYVNESTVVTDEVIESIYEMFVRYITEVGIQPGANGLYNIRVDEFKEYLADTEYSKYKYTDIRAGLANFTKEINGKTVKGTKCSFGRTDNTIAAEKDKRIKVISFVPEVVASYQVTELPTASTRNV